MHGDLKQIWHHHSSTSKCMSTVVSEVITILPPDPAPGVGGRACWTLWNITIHLVWSPWKIWLLCHTNWCMLRVPMIFSVEAPYLGLRVWFVPRDCLCSFIYLFISLIHQQSYQKVAAKGIRHADGKARPTGTYSFPDKLSLKTNIYSLQTTTTEK